MSEYQQQQGPQGQHVQQGTQTPHSTTQSTRREGGLIHKMGGTLSRSKGRLFGAAVFVAAGMGLESQTNYAHNLVQQGKVARHLIDGYRLVGDPMYRNASIDLHVDHDKKVMYGVLKDESRDIELRIHEGLLTRNPVPHEFYRIVKEDLEQFWIGVNEFADSARTKTERGARDAWEKTRQTYEKLVESIEEKVK